VALGTRWFRLVSKPLAPLQASYLISERYAMTSSDQQMRCRALPRRALLCHSIGCTTPYLTQEAHNPLGSAPSIPFIEEGVFMHELGHNLGLHHAGDVASPARAPNYLSVMNYKYTFSGIQHAATPGSTVPVEDLRELNYSEHTLNTLVESNLDEKAGTSPLSSGYTGIVRFFNAVGGNARGAEAGPIDWDGINGIDPNPVVVDINQLNGATETMVGYRDWDRTTGQSGSGGGACTASADCRVNRPP
jgi:hypothetical protein